MPRTRLSTKGQLIVPQEVRERLGWTPGTVLDVAVAGESIVVKRALEVPRTTVDDLLGILDYKGPPKTIEEMEEAIAQAASENR